MTLLALAVQAGCPRDRAREERSAAAGSPVPRPERAAPASAGPPREPGPPRLERAGQLNTAAEEARRLLEVLVRSGVSPREAASVADMRGYRLYRRRYFGQALAWFRAAVTVDPSYELSHFNAARCAALLGDVVAARRSLERLRVLDTPLARARLARAATEPDLAGLRHRPDAGPGSRRRGQHPDGQSSRR